uniref:Uncharacterized protein n=1 Tax=Dunaliella tertiolecta TaxID=3047 RepID=A0A7S3QXK0_DUNTE
MALLALQAQAEDALCQLFERARAADAVRHREQAAAIVLQKHCRGFLVRRRLDRFRDIAIEIQRAWRGYLGRHRAYVAREARDRHLREAYFATKATNIQRHWRGFWSRKYLFDFYARKLYLRHVAAVNAQVRAAVAEEGERAAKSQKALAEAAARSAFETKVSQLHHLVSTTSQPGIFNSPYAIATGSVPFIAGAPVEEHLKQVSKKAGKLPASLRASVNASTNLDSTGRPTHRPKRPNTSTIAQQQQQQLLRQQGLHQTAPAGSTFLPPISKTAGDHAKSAASAVIVDSVDEGLANTEGGMNTTNSAGFQVRQGLGQICAV